MASSWWSAISSRHCGHFDNVEFSEHAAQSPKWRHGITMTERGSCKLCVLVSHDIGSSLFSFLNLSGRCLDASRLNDGARKRRNLRKAVIITIIMQLAEIKQQEADDRIFTGKPSLQASTF